MPASVCAFVVTEFWVGFECLHFQIDLLENQAINDVVILSVVLEEVRNKNLAVYNRLRAVCSNSLRRFFVFSNEYHRYVSFSFKPV